MIEVEKWLHSRIGLNFRSGLGRMQRAVDLLGNPEQTYPIIHVTGTNGKGSTIAFMRELFVSHGKKVGTFTSPHIVSIHDRICINSVFSTNLQFRCQSQTRHRPSPALHPVILPTSALCPESQ